MSAAFRVFRALTKLHSKIATHIAAIVAASSWCWLLAIFTKWLFVHLRQPSRRQPTRKQLYAVVKIGYRLHQNLNANGLGDLSREAFSERTAPLVSLIAANAVHCGLRCSGIVSAIWAWLIPGGKRGKGCARSMTVIAALSSVDEPELAASRCDSSRPLRSMVTPIRTVPLSLLPLAEYVA
jgi:hypothetical protein